MGRRKKGCGKQPARAGCGGRQVTLTLDEEVWSFEYIPDHLPAACWMHGRRGPVIAPVCSPSGGVYQGKYVATEKSAR